ncbi:hypothetical protein P3S68_002897 [Capsicum galapagoense]
MTINIAESINAVLLDEREFSITTLFDTINKRFAKIFHERRMIFLDIGIKFFPSMETIIVENTELGNKLFVHQIANYRYIVTCHEAVATVDLQSKSCSCRVFDVDKIPCPYAMAALRCQYGEDYGRQNYEYSSLYYTVDAYIMAYVEENKPVPSEDSWQVPIEILERNISSPFVEQGMVGRRLYKRRKGVRESFSTKKNKFSICKRVGHKKTTCSERNAS